MSKFSERFEISHEEFTRSCYRELVQAIKMLQERFGEEEVLRTLREGRSEAVATWVAREDLKSRGPVVGLRDFSSHIREALCRNKRNHQTYIIEEDTDNRFRYTITEFIWARAFKGLKATDIGHAWLCHADYAYAKAHHPKISLSREKTLMQGDDICDMDYRWV
jgi:hypothetical protein